MPGDSYGQRLCLGRRERAVPGGSHVGEDDHARKATPAGAVPTRNRNLRTVSLSTYSPAGAPAGGNAASEGTQLPANPNSSTQCSPNWQSTELPTRDVTRGCITEHSGNLCPLSPFRKIVTDTTHYGLREVLSAEASGPGEAPGVSS